MSPTRLPTKYRGTPALVLASFLFALMALFARLLAGHLSVGQQVVGRFVVGLVFLALYFPATGRRPRFGRPSLWALRGLFGGGAVYLYFVSIERLALGPATLLNNCWPIWAAVLSALFLREHAGRHVVTGLVLSTVGAGLVILGSAPAGAAGWDLGVGAWAGLASALLSGAAVTTVRALRNDTDAATIFLSFCLFGLLFGTPFAVADWRPLTPTALWLLLGVGLASVAAQMLFTQAFAYVTAAAGGVTTQLTPAFSWALGALLLGEHAAPLAVGGALLCVAGVLWGTVLGGRLRAGTPPQAEPSSVAR